MFRMNSLRLWIRRRRWTLGLACFFVFWHILQLGVLHFVSESAARWLFYLQQPPNIVSPGLVLAPVSHSLYTWTHLGANLLILLVTGGLAEPHIGEDRIIVLVVGFGYLGIYLANATVLVHLHWMVAGASGGILSLWAYTGLQMHDWVLEFFSDGLVWSHRGLETMLTTVLLLGIPALLFHQIWLVDPPHSGHIIGLVLGCLYYGIESYRGRPEQLTR